MNRRYAGIPVALSVIVGAVVAVVVVVFAAGLLDAPGNDTSVSAQLPAGSGADGNSGLDSCTTGSQVSWDHASGHVEQRVALVGPVMNVQSSSQGAATVTLGDRDSGTPVSVQITSSMAGTLPQTPQELYDGKTLCVVGVLQAVGAKYQIIAEQPSDISIYSPS